MSPANIARRFFRAYCHPDFVEDLEGDLDELHTDRIAHVGRRKADWLYARDVLLLFRPAIIRSVGLNCLSSNTSPAMYRNYFKTGLRNLLKYKSYAVLNIFGLAVGIAASIVLFLIVRYEQSFDAFHAEHERIYRVGEQRTGDSEVLTHYYTKAPLVPALIENYPEVVDGTRFYSRDETRFRYQSNTVAFPVHYVDPGFLALFDTEVLAGSLSITLTQADYIAITQSVAEKVFGHEDAIGKVLEAVHDEQQFVVGAVIADSPKNSSLQYEALVPWLNAPEQLGMDQMGNWYNTFMVAYVKLRNVSDAVPLEEKLVAFKDQHFTNNNLADLRLFLLPLAELRAEETENGHIITLLSVIALVTLVIACINFMNLTTAQSLLRLREIGVRKAIGSRRSQIAFQFLTESTMTGLLALVIGVLLVKLALPWFNAYFELAITFSFWQNIPLFATLLGVGVMIGLLSGLYPALFASGMHPVVSLKGRGSHPGSGRLLQRGLIVVQYAASILLIAGTLVIWRQVQFMRTQDLHFDRENVAVVPISYNNFAFESEEQAMSSLQRVRRELLRETSVNSLAFAENVPGRYSQNYNHFSPGDTPNQEAISLRQITVGANYFATLGIDIVEGRTFSEALASDSNAVVLNQTAMQALGWTDVEDKYLSPSSGNATYQVVGVIQDFHYQSLQHEIQPMVHFYGGNDFAGTWVVRLSTATVSEGLQALAKAHQSLNPYEAFDYFFLDQEFDQMYKEQERLGLTATLFAGIAVILASLGLLALAAFSTRQRYKEVGVRKVLGASVSQIVILLSRNFALLVLLAFVVACPLAYYAADHFLQDFAYRIAVEPDIFLIAGAIAFLIAAVSVGVQAFRAASSDPVNALRDE